MAMGRRSRIRLATSPASAFPGVAGIVPAVAAAFCVLCIIWCNRELQSYRDEVAGFRGDIDKMSGRLIKLIRMEQERRTDASIILSHSNQGGISEKKEDARSSGTAFLPRRSDQTGTQDAFKKIYIFTYGGPPAWDPPKRMPLGFCLGVESAMQQRLNVEVLGPAMHDSASTKKFDDPKALKPFVLLNRLKTLPENALVLFNDALDVWFTPHSTEDAFVDAFDIDDDTILVSAERNCWPPADRMPYCRDYPPSKHGTSYKYVNTGGWMGRAKASIAMLQAWTACILDGKDEQGCVHWFYRDAPESRRYREKGGKFGIALDDTQQIWQTLWGTKFNNAEVAAFSETDAAGFGDESSGRLVNPETSTKPLVLHFNGPKDTLVQWMKKWRRHYLVEPVFRAGMITFWGEERHFYTEICPHNFLPRLPSRKVA